MISGLQYSLLNLNTETVNPNSGGFYFLRMIFIECQKVQSIIQISLPRAPVYVINHIYNMVSILYINTLQTNIGKWSRMATIFPLTL